MDASSKVRLAQLKAKEFLICHLPHFRDVPSFEKWIEFWLMTFPAIFGDNY
jgi:hypothetical protein